MTNSETLQALADRLGTNVEHLLGVLIAQAPMSAFTDLIVMAAWFVGVLIWARYVRKKTTAPPASKGGTQYPRPPWDDEMIIGVAWLSVFICGMLAALMFLLGLPDFIIAVTNPEYWAMRQLLLKE